jgi:hypothetical protein
MSPWLVAGLQAPVLSGRLVKLAAPSHTEQTVLKLFAYVFAPPGSPLDQYTADQKSS